MIEIDQLERKKNSEKKFFNKICSFLFVFKMSIYFRKKSNESGQLNAYYANALKYHFKRMLFSHFKDRTIS